MIDIDQVNSQPLRERDRETDRLIDTHTERDRERQRQRNTEAFFIMESILSIQFVLANFSPPFYDQSLWKESSW